MGRRAIAAKPAAVQELPGDDVFGEEAPRGYPPGVSVQPAAVPEQVQQSPLTPAQGGEASPWGALVEDLQRLDVEAVYRELRAKLSLGDDSAQYGALRAATDESSQQTFNALLLARRAKLREEAVEREVGLELEVLRTSARAELEKEKEAGTRKKAITNDDVADAVRARWPKQSKELEEKQGEARAVRAIAEGLYSVWQVRCATLRALLDNWQR